MSETGGTITCDEVVDGAGDGTGVEGEPLVGVEDGVVVSTVVVDGLDSVVVGEREVDVVGRVPGTVVVEDGSTSVVVVGGIVVVVVVVVGVVVVTTVVVVVGVAGVSPLHTFHHETLYGLPLLGLSGAKYATPAEGCPITGPALGPPLI